MGRSPQISPIEAAGELFRNISGQYKIRRNEYLQGVGRLSHAGRKLEFSKWASKSAVDSYFHRNDAKIKALGSLMAPMLLIKVQILAQSQPESWAGILRSPLRLGQPEILPQSKSKQLTPGQTLSLYTTPALDVRT